MMKVSTRTEYGLRCLLLLAKQQSAGDSLAISEIAGQERLPKHYVQQIMLKLSRAGIVKSTRGTQGGFALVGTPADISVGSILRVLEGVPFKDTCGQFNKRTNCGHMGNCGIRPVWEMISQQLWETLDRINLQQLVADEKTVGRTLALQLPVLSTPVAACHSDRPS